MGLIGAAMNAGVVAAVGLALAWVMKGRFEAVDKRFDAVDRRFDSIDRRLDLHDQRMDRMEERFEQRLDSRFNTLQASIDTMRSDRTRIALAVGVEQDSA